MNRKPRQADAIADLRSRLRTLLLMVIGLALGTMMLSCRNDSSPVGPSGPGTPPPAEWRWQNPLPQGNTLQDVSFTDADTGTAVGWHGTILRTTDGGATWVSQSSGTTNVLQSVSFTGAQTGTAVGWFGTIVRTTDGGASWVSQSSGTMNPLLDVSFTDVNRGTAVGIGGMILRTTDGGGP